MSEFINALYKTEPKLFEEEKGDSKMINVDDQPTPTGVTLQDMKDYFDALKQSITDDMKKEILETIKAQQNESNANNGDTNITNNNKEE